MRCPYCANPALEGLQECPRCGFALHKLDALFGAIPRLAPGVSDQSSLFTHKEIRKLGKEITRLHRRFPQLNFHIVTANLNASDHLGAYAFWILNKAGICSEMTKGGANFNVLLVIDALNARASMIVGYGLEPFVGERHLAAAVAAAAPLFHQRLFLDATLAALAELNRNLTQICNALDQTYGIKMKDLRPEQSAQNAAAPGDSPY